MKSLRHQIIVAMLGSLIILSICLIFAFSWHTREQIISSANDKTKEDLATSMEIVNLSYPGAWHLESGALYKGPAQISGNTALVDHLAALTGNSITFFQGDTRVATTILNEDGTRALGTKVSSAVAEKVLQQGATYLGTANILGKPYQTAYEPLRDSTGTVIGMFYTGISMSLVEDMATHFLFQSILIGAVITILIGIFAYIFLRRFIITPLRAITLSTRDVASGHPASKIKLQKGPKEINELTLAFNQLVETMGALTHQLAKVESDTSSASGPGANFVCPSPPADEVFSPAIKEEGSSPTIKEEELPKGLNYSTLQQIFQHLKAIRKPVSAEDVAEGVRLTRVTVKRYLEFLEYNGFLISELKYGTVGRPVKIFSLKPNNQGGDDLA